MRKLKWKYNKRRCEWGCTNYIHPTITIQLLTATGGYRKDWYLKFKGKVDVFIPFDKASTAKKVAELIHNG